MTTSSNAEMTSGNKAAWSLGGRRMRGALVVIMGCLAMLAPLFAGRLAASLVGLLLVACGVLEMLETFRFPDESSQRSAYLSGAFSILVGLLLLNRPKFILGGLAVLLAGSFLIDGISKTVAAWKARAAGMPWEGKLGTGLVNVGLSLVLATGWPISGLVIVEVLAGIRMLAAGWAMVLGREEMAPTPPAVGVHPDRRLNLPPHPEFIRLENTLKIEEEGRRSIDAYWCWMFVVLFFAIHLGRMNIDWNLVGMISPLFAVLGDVVTTLMIAFGLILPFRLAWRKLTRPLERRGWKRRLAQIDEGKGKGLTGTLSEAWLMHRLRFARRLAQICHSPRAALRWSMQVGLPVTAVLIAVNPIWGLNWFFNSESWSTGIWDRWAEARTDTWRENMIEAVQDKYREKGIPADQLFQVKPDGVAGSEDFSFLVIGDTGEGGLAQHSLRDQYLFLGKRPDVKFLVLSSDVIYPAGAMRDYEPKFYLPFKGFTKPIYAIPGNHDWYDALEGFAANFLEEDAARASMLSRVETDGRLTTTTEGRIDRYIKEASRLRKEFGVSTGLQRGPFFEVQTDRFALIAVDTGVLKSVDNNQWEWLKAALVRAKGKSIMAILGHPLYAGGRYQGGDDIPIAGEWIGDDHHSEPIVAIHRLLREHQVDIVMAGDTHYFEHYMEKYKTAKGTRTMQHFVNGGGGAYISIGTPLDWPKHPAVPDCAFFPRTDAAIAKLDRDTPSWKMPLWLWTKHLRAWPFTAETMAAAFDYNRAPFFQSFVEVRVEGSTNRIRLIPHGANGPLRWQEMQTFGAVVPAGKTGDDFVEFIIPISPRRA
jgi:uncharacterized membrane protein HdeD (DUF308 family)